jgi:hypothetical protein
MTEKQFIDLEVRVRVMEELVRGVNERFDRTESKDSAQFYFLTGLVVTSIVVPVVLHLLKLV